MKLTEIIIAASLVGAMVNASETSVDAAIKSEVKAEETTYSTDPYTGDVMACNETGCRIVSTGTTDATTDDHFKLASAAVGPNEVMLCTDEGCRVVDARAVDPDKVTPVCDDGKCVLTPNG